MKQKLEQAFVELQQIYVRGIDTIHMSKALTNIEEVLNELPKLNQENSPGGISEKTK